MNQKTMLASFLGLIFVVGAGIILYRGRPVMQMEATDTQATSTVQNMEPTATTTNPQIVVADEPKTPTSIEKAVSSTKPSAKPATPSTPKANEYTLAQVQAHGSASDCWATLGGNVYDLTSWVSRHPGGERPIEGLCGTDASAKFERKHGGSSVAKAALTLLKIGTLR